MIQITKIFAAISIFEASVASIFRFITSFFLTTQEKTLASTEAKYLQKRYYKGNYFTTQGLGSIGEIVIAVIGESITGGTFALTGLLVAKVLIGVRLPFSLMAYRLFVQGQAHALLLFSRSETLRKNHLNVRLATLAYWGSITFVKLTVLLMTGIFSPLTIKLYCVYYFFSFFFGSPKVTKYNEYKGYN